VAAQQGRHFGAVMGDGIVERSAAGVVAGVQVSTAGEQEIGDLDATPEGGPVQGRFATAVAAIEELGVALEERFDADQIAIPRGIVNGSTEGGHGQQENCEQDRTGSGLG
jgi:hypothetical protein